MTKKIETYPEYEAALTTIWPLMDAEPGSDDEKELDRLSTLVEEYEQEHFSIGAPFLSARAAKFRVGQVRLALSVGDAAGDGVIIDEAVDLPREFPCGKEDSIDLLETTLEIGSAQGTPDGCIHPDDTFTIIDMREVQETGYRPAYGIVRVYIASPYTQGDSALNVRTQILAAEQIRKAGLLPFVPLLSHLWHLISPHEHEYWMAMDLEWILVCDAVLRLPGPSKGADTEVAFARERGVPVYFSVEEIREAFPHGEEEQECDDTFIVVDMREFGKEEEREN